MVNVLSVISTAVVLVLLIILIFILSKIKSSFQDTTELKANFQALTQSQMQLFSTLQNIQSDLNNKITQQSLIVQEIKAKVETGNITSQELTRQIQESKEVINKIKTIYDARIKEEQETKNAVVQLKNLLIGSKSKGVAGEQILQEALSVLPPNIVEYNFRIKNKVVEFGLRIGDKILPIDSKFPKPHLVLEFEKTEVEEQKNKLAKDIEKTVLDQIDNVSQYIDPEVTEPLAVMAVPDSIFYICTKARSEASKKNIILIPYSMMVPYLITFLHLKTKYAVALDIDNMKNYLQKINLVILNASEILESQMAKGIVQVTNAYKQTRELVAEIRDLISKIERQY